MLAQAAGKPIRIASKSVRSVAVLRRILELDPGFEGILSFTLPEALFLARQGFENIVVAYPTADREALAELVELAAAEPARAPVPMVDSPPHLDLIESAIGGGPAEVRVCLDLDVGWWPLGGKLARIGPKRSPVRTPERARQMAAEIEERPGTRLVGVMAYEGHIAGVGDRIPGRPLRSALIRRMQSASERDIHRRLPRIVDAVRELASLEFVNGGGTGSLARTAAAGVVTELTAGSGFYDPVLFDHYRSLALTPAAFFVLPIVRRPAPGVVTALGGGYLASGVAGTGPPAGALPARGPSARQAGGRGRGADAAARDRGAGACGSAIASTCATPRPASSASASARSTWWRATGSSTRCRPTGARARRSSSELADRAEHAVGVGVREAALGVEPGADLVEVAPARVEPLQRLGGLEVALAPVRAPLVVGHDPLDGPEVGLPGRPLVLVDGDVGGLALVGGAEQRVVGGDEPELDRKADRELALAHQAQHPAHRLRPVLARDRVLHLREPDAALGGEDPVAAVGPLGVRELARGEADQPRDRGGKAAPDPGEQVHGVVLEHDLVQVGADAPARARGAVDAVALDRQRRVGVGEDEELEVVVARRQLVEAGQGLLERAGASRRDAG